MTAPLTADATDCWRESLRVVEGRAAAVRDALAASRARLGGGALPLLWVPPLLTAAERARIARIVEGVHRGLVAVASALRDQSIEGSEPLPLPANARALAPAGDELRTPLQCCRLDALYDPATGALAFLEVQAGDPSGAGLCDVVIDALADAGVLAALSLPRTSMSASHRDVLLHPMPGGAASRAPLSADPFVVFACPDRAASFIIADHEAMAAQYRRLGTRAVRAAPRALVVREGRVHLGGAPVDAIVRDAPDDVTDADEVALRAALRAGVHYLNPFADARFDDKTCFALLRHPQVQARLDGDARAIIASHVPETLAVDDAVRSQLAQARCQWVLKPTFGYGGFGVVVGPHVDNATWAEGLMRSRAVPTVAQRAVASAPVTWPVIVDDGVALAPRFTTWSFWLHGGRFTQAFVRAGVAAVVNVHQGGGIGPVLFR